MNEIFEILYQIEQATGKQKQLILENELRNDDSQKLSSFIELFYDDTNYNLSKRSWEKIVDFDKNVQKTYPDPGLLCATKAGSMETIKFDTFIELLENCEKLTGNDLLEYCKANILCWNPNTIKWVVRFLNKDLRIGMNLKTINKALDNSGYEPIEKFAVQLCGKYDDIKKYDKGFPCLVGVKYDGFRAVIEKKGDIVTITSRQGKEVTFIPELIEYFSKIMVDFIFDGEILADDFSLIQKRIGRKLENIEPVPSLHYRIYDIIEFNGEVYSDKNQLERYTKLNELATMPTIFDNKLVKREETFMITNQVMLEAIYKVAMIRNEEGIIIKLLDKPYGFDSRKNWFKVKKCCRDVTVKIVGSEKGTGKYKDCIAKLLIEDESGRIKGKAGSGISLADIKIFEELESKNELIGKYCDIHFMEVTTKILKDIKTHSFRHAVFDKLRFDKIKGDAVELPK